MPENYLHISVRDAQAADLTGLVEIKGQGSEALHRDRLQDAQSPGYRYLVLLADQKLIGFACLVFRRPEYWSDAGDTQHLPQIVDLQVEETHRGQGYGSAFLHALEQEVRAAGSHHIFLSVAPVDNPRAYALYGRLGYQQIQPEPYLKRWSFQDSSGKIHKGEDWIVDMVKTL